ncbi:hypothetical protein GCM10008097_28700 [Mycetocola manganoxydans]|nr:hypothetical protein GCM10008097_28700 [Mycetocola manganoxydans]
MVSDVGKAMRFPFSRGAFEEGPWTDIAIEHIGSTSAKTDVISAIKERARADRGL